MKRSDQVTKQYSIDLFDTLVTRLVARPDDVFALLHLRDNAPDSLLRRREAEREAEKHNEATLDNIYQILFSNPDEARIWQECEIEIERLVLRARPVGIERLERMRATGVPIAILSDTPHAAETLKEFVEQTISQAPQMIFSSASEGASKRNGGLFQRLKDHSGVAAHQILHIGDNEAVDVKSGKAAGLRTELLLSPLDNYLAHSHNSFVFGKFGHNLTPAESVVIGLSKNRWFDCPQSSPYSGNLKQFGYIAYGPCVLAISLWLLREARKRDKRRILCFSRDGHVFANAINKLADRFKLEETATYLYASRQFSRLIEVQDETGLRKLLTSRRGSPLEKLQACLGRLPEEFNKQWPDVDSLLEEKGIQLLSLLARQRKSYARYLESYCLEDGDLTFDIGYQGTTQCALQNFMGVQLLGCYIQIFPEIERLLPDYDVSTASYIATSGDASLDRLFQRYRQLHEAVLSAPHGSFIGFKEDGAPDFASHRPLSALNELHDGISLFIDDFAAGWPYGEDKVELRPEFAFAHVHQHYRTPTSVSDVSMFDNFELDDAFAGSKPAGFVTPPGDHGHRSIWLEGHRLMYGVNFGSYLIGPIKKLLGRLVVQTFVTMSRDTAKKRKIERNPVLFFADSKKRYLRPLMKLFC